MFKIFGYPELFPALLNQQFDTIFCIPPVSHLSRNAFPKLHVYHLAFFSLPRALNTFWFYKTITGGSG
jgi:hypothetical protein